MIQRLLAIVLLSVIPYSSSIPLGPTRSLNQEPCVQDHIMWVARALEKMKTIKVGMTQKDLLKVFTTEGGLSTGLQRRFVS